MILSKQTKILGVVGFLMAVLIVLALVIKIQATSETGLQANTHPDQALLNWFDNSESHYRIRYPAGWERQDAETGTVIFTGGIGTPSFYSTVNIQSILSKKIGGDYKNMKAFMADIKKQAREQSRQVKFLKEGTLQLKDALGKKMQAEYLLFTYQYKNEVPFKQWQIVVFRNDQQVFYAFAYSAPESQYDADYPIAKAMLDSWIIY